MKQFITALILSIVASMPAAAFDVTDQEMSGWGHQTLTVGAPGFGFSIGRPIQFFAEEDPDEFDIEPFGISEGTVGISVETFSNIMNGRCEEHQFASVSGEVGGVWQTEARCSADEVEASFR